MSPENKQSYYFCKKPLLCGFLLCLLSVSATWAQRVRDCAFSPVYQQHVQKIKAAAVQRQAFEDSIQAFVEQRKNRGGRTADRIIRIPVVVHVIHNTADSNRIGGTGNANISVAQIESQIRVLNEDYRRQEGTRGYNTNPVGADMEIEFYLANRDPNGNPTNGIVRRYRNQAVYNIQSDLETVSALSYWPSNRYLNIWVLPDIRNYLGYGQFPASTSVEGLNAYYEDFPQTDGVFIAHQYFGDTGNLADETYSYGRTLTHEVGHWLGLIHTWGDQYCGTDYCDDTPPTESANNTRFCNDRYSTCVSGQSTRNMIENFLDYSPDACMNTFTQDQKSRVRAVLELSPRRRQLVAATNLLEETEKLVVKVYDHPIRNQTITFEATFKGIQPIEYSLLDLQGHLVYAARQSSQPSSLFSISGVHLAPAVYVLRFTAGAETLSMRLVVQ